MKSMLVYDCELWRNEDIGRGLEREEVKRVAEDFVNSGHGGWEDSAKVSSISPVKPFNSLLRSSPSPFPRSRPRHGSR